MKAILNQEKFDHVVLQKEKKILIYYCTQGAKKGFGIRDMTERKSLENLGIATNLLNQVCKEFKIEESYRLYW